MKILFVCTGNTCRSPMAEGVCKKLFPQYEVSSRGVNVFMPVSISENARLALSEDMGVDLSGHSSKQITEDDVKNADLVLTMTYNHRDFLKENYPQYAGKIYTLMEYTHGLDMDISDPYGGSLEIYKSTLKQIYACVRELEEK